MYRIIEKKFGIKTMYGITHPDWLGCWFDTREKAEKIIERMNKNENQEKL